MSRFLFLSPPPPPAQDQAQDDSKAIALTSSHAQSRIPLPLQPSPPLWPSCCTPSSLSRRNGLRWGLLPPLRPSGAPVFCSEGFRAVQSLGEPKPDSPGLRDPVSAPLPDPTASSSPRGPRSSRRSGALAVPSGARTFLSASAGAALGARPRCFLTSAWLLPPPLPTAAPMLPFQGGLPGCPIGNPTPPPTLLLHHPHLPVTV